MDAKIEKRRAFLINIAYFVLILGAVYVFFRFAFWPTSPFLFAFFFAVVMQKPVEFITSKTPLKRGIASLLLTLLSLLIVVGLLTLLGTKIYSEIRAFISYLMATFDNVPDFIATAREWTLNKVNALPRVVGRTAAPYIDRFFNTLTGSFT
ncbi:MAG: AI-2E family transporter, partial [Clostridia bacterium]|nr:AI-2E family transporter [Clostridia bacterium]